MTFPSTLLEKLARVNDLESDIAEVGFWLLRYQRSQKPEDKQLLLQNETEFRDALVQFNALRLSAAERRWASMLEEGFNHMIALVHQTLDLEDQLRRYTRQFVRIRLEIDAIVDEKMQTLALTGAALLKQRTSIFLILGSDTFKEETLRIAG